ncbi:MAG: CPBP family intramembrane metalloprotease [Deltaproteobacteria bacterium]|nr:CPBP family intramembrane metalloprotease [Deltaproteobacteria bacterium]
MPWHGRGELAASLVMIFPALLAYQVGVLFTGHVNGADVVTRALYAALGGRGYLILHACVAAGFIVWLRRDGRTSTLRADVLGPVLLEAALYALTLGAAIEIVLTRLLGLGITGGQVINALGAGVHEELVFRLLWFGGLVYLARRWFPGAAPRLVWLAILVASSVAFSAAHHAGPLGEPFSMHVFAYRALAGAAFAAMFWFRSLAHAVYAHILYDLLVYWSWS